MAIVERDDRRAQSSALRDWTTGEEALALRASAKSGASRRPASGAVERGCLIGLTTSRRLFVFIESVDGGGSG